MVTSKPRSAADEDRNLRPFLREGRIIRWPAREKRQRLVLSEVVRAFALGKRMPEAEVDEILIQFWPDYCLLRRALVDYEFLNRRAGIYWRVG